MAHLGERLDGDDLRLALPELGAGLQMEVPLPEISEEGHTAPDLRLLLRHRSLPPALMDGRQLSELLRLLGALDPRPLLPHRRDSPDQRWPGDVGDGEPCPRHRRPRALEVDPVVGVPVSELDPVRIVAHRVLRLALADPHLEARSGAIPRHDRAGRPTGIGTTSALVAQNGDPPSHEDRHDDRQAGLALVDLPDQVLVHELLLDGEVGVRSEPPQDPVEQDLVAIVHLDVGVAGRGVPDHRPGERLKSRVRERRGSGGVPPCTGVAVDRLDRYGKDHLDAVERVVGP